MYQSLPTDDNDIRNLTNLTGLCLDNNNITDYGLSKLTNLTFIDLWQYHIH